MNVQDAEDSLANYISSFKDVTTTNGGIAEIQNVEYGLYVLRTYRRGNRHSA